MNYYKISLSGKVYFLMSSKGHFDTLLTIVKDSLPGEFIQPRYGMPAYKFYTPNGYAYVYSICGSDLLLPEFKYTDFKEV